MPIDPPEDAHVDELGALEPALQGAQRTGRRIEPKGNGNLDSFALLIGSTADVRPATCSTSAALCATSGRGVVVTHLDPTHPDAIPGLAGSGGPRYTFSIW